MIASQNQRVTFSRLPVALISRFQDSRQFVFHVFPTPDRWGVGNDQRYIDDYLTLNVATIKRLLEAEDPGRPFMLSSPSNGAETVKQGGISDFPTSNLYGDSEWNCLFLYLIYICFFCEKRRFTLIFDS
ncbi:hypothetical protein DPMN_079364 [Dreissena polymorpha]|uniref:Uncharacterized protein n=1 Tax=Dreissena polymorpha TaxID=45954 RepID=A0A9D3YUC1_DREPO|nr:hypothetical protein DPMN_079364 [Dreissena polymorpha]